ncbi:tissue factor pathway inhibitor-like [Pectinophora gossypiella]|uniref:tissue factor pathway inhibitor-like n=1 Tax=Pectinophora gossypiella TaxID=13191 RepID=UPI00214DF3A2|nr:tissue factor pathway inhibitor-like [Pectinophora gossypiella]
MSAVSAQQRTTKFCVAVTNALRARRKACFLRPDTGPCRADIVQWYFDAQQHKCYRYFWGGCQGNGNRFSTKEECYDYCYLNQSIIRTEKPYFCSLAFDYGSCFGHYYRWYWDNSYKTCKRRIYSGCGGNQNNFQSRKECYSKCVQQAKNALVTNSMQFTTCMALDMPGNQNRRK